MLWFFTALIGYFFLAVTNVLDKFILTKSVPRPEVLTFYSTIVMFLAVLAVPFGVMPLVGIDWLWATVSGIAFGFALYFLFLGVQVGEQSHIAPFNGAVVSITTYLISYLFLQEQLTQAQVGGIVVLIAASLLLSFEKSRRYDGFHIGFLWAAVSGVLFAMAHVSAKYIYANYDFFSGLVWTKVAMGAVGLLMLLHPSVRAIFSKKKKKPQTKETFERKYALVLVYTSKFVAVLAAVLIQFSISIGSVTLVTALAGLQFVFLYIMIYVLSVFAPKIFKEDFTQREVVIEFVGILMVAAGSALFVL